MRMDRVEELILQSLEHEMGGVKIYAAALQCVVHAKLKQEWEKYAKQTATHVTALEEVCAAMRIDPMKETPGRKVVRHNGAALVSAMKMALGAGNPVAAEIVACECVVLAETKDHADWELLMKCAEELGEKGEALEAACEKVEDEEDEHLYHTKGWCRELWLESLGLSAVLPPPEERRHVKTAIGASRAEQLAEKDR